MSNHRTERSRRPLAVLSALAVLALSIAAGLSGNAGSVHADDTAVTSDAALTWKVSQYAWTFTSVAQDHGTIAPATKDTANGFVFPQGQGSYNPATGAASINFTGGLQLGNTSQGGYKIQFIDPSIVIDENGIGSLVADVTFCTGAGGTAPCGQTWPVVSNVTIVTFDVANGTLTDNGSEVTLTVTPDYQLQGDATNPTRRQFPPALIGTFGDGFTTGALANSLVSHFRDSGSGNDVNKPPAPLTVTFSYEEAPPSASQTITTTVLQSGGLSISVEDTQVTLPTPQLNGGGTALVSSGALNPVTVTDLRLANPGWNANGQVSAFTSATSSFGGEHLGWTPEVISTSESQTVTPGASVAPGTGIATSSTLGSAAAGEGRGTAVLGADLELEIPTNTEPGEYSATVTLTVV